MADEPDLPWCSFVREEFEGGRVKASAIEFHASEDEARGRALELLAVYGTGAWGEIRGPIMVEVGRETLA